MPLKARIWSFLKTATCFFASLAPTPLFRSHRSRRRLHRVVAAFWLSVFTSVFTPVFQLFLTIITIFCHFDVATMRLQARYSAGNDKLT